MSNGMREISITKLAKLSTRIKALLADIEEREGQLSFYRADNENLRAANRKLVKELVIAKADAEGAKNRCDAIGYALALMRNVIREIQVKEQEKKFNESDNLALAVDDRKGKK